MTTITAADNQSGALALRRSTVFDLIRRRSFGLRKVKLASGRESDFYFDLKPTMLAPEGAAFLPELILPTLEGLGVGYVGGLAMGAVPLVSVVAAASCWRGRPLPAFFVRKAVKDHGTQRLLEGLGPGESLAGQRVAVLEDVTTTGGSALEAVRAVQEAGATVAIVLSVVDREEGAAEFYAAQGLRFDAIFRAGEFLRAVGAR